MDWGQRSSEISPGATRALGFLRWILAFASGSAEEVACKTLVQPELECVAPVWGLPRGFRFFRWGGFGGHRPADPAGDRGARVVSAGCLDRLGGRLLGPVGIGPPCFSWHNSFWCCVCGGRQVPGRPLIAVWGLHYHRAVPGVVDTRHTVMPRRTLFSPELFRGGVVFLLRLSISGPLVGGGGLLIWSKKQPKDFFSKFQN